MPKKGARIVPKGFVKTSFEITQAAKFALEDLKRSVGRELRIDGHTGLSEAALVEFLILAAKKKGFDDDALTALTKLLKGRKKAQERPEGPGK